MRFSFCSSFTMSGTHSASACALLQPRRGSGYCPALCALDCTACSCQRPTTSSSRPVRQAQPWASARAQTSMCAPGCAAAPRTLHTQALRSAELLCSWTRSCARWSEQYGTDVCYARRRACRHRCAHRKAMPQRKRCARPAARTWTPTWTRRSSARRTKALARGRPRPCWLPARPGTPAPPGALLRG